MRDCRPSVLVNFLARTFELRGRYITPPSVSRIKLPIGHGKMNMASAARGLLGIGGDCVVLTVQPLR